jgi:diguanylate cyclase (GGDEF)-like protein
LNLDHPTSLTFAIGFIQNVQLACFAVVFVLMAWLDRKDLSFRWLAFAYVSGLVGGAFQFADGMLPGWITIPSATIAAPIGYACIHAGIVEFLGRGARTRWISLVLLAATLPLYVIAALPAYNSHFEQMSRIATLADLTLAIQTALSCSLLLASDETVTLWPRRVMGTFLAFYSTVEFARVAVFLITGQLPDRVAPWVEVASGIVYVVSCSVLPMNFIWMMNARLHTHMARQMTTDPLTQVLNRRGLQNAGELEISRYGRDGNDFALVLMDIDHFKRLNDTYGHASGDGVLAETAALVRDFVRMTDTVGRLGGEEFVLLLSNTGITGAGNVVESLRTRLQQHAFKIGERKIGITASFGITLSAGRANLTWDTLLTEADQALYSAKHDGRNCTRFYDPSLAATQEKTQAAF